MVAVGHERVLITEENKFKVLWREFCTAFPFEPNARFADLPALPPDIFPFSGTQLSQEIIEGMIVLVEPVILPVPAGQ